MLRPRLQEHGKFEYELRPALLATVLEEAVRAHETAAATAGLRLALDCTPVLRNFLLMMDAGRIGQVVTNFLSNAVKFTPSGGAVTVRAILMSVPAQPEPPRANADTGSNSTWTVRVSVSDTGRGLGQSELARLFQPYAQIRAAEMQAGCVCFRARARNCVPRVCYVAAAVVQWGDGPRPGPVQALH